MQVACGILFCRLRNFAQRQVNHFRKKDKDDQGQQEQDDQDNIGNTEQAFTGGTQRRHGGMDDHIAPDLEIGGDGRINAQHFPFEAVIKGSDGIVGAGGFRSVEALDDAWVIQIHRSGGVHNHTAGGIDNPYGGIQVDGKGIQLCFYRFQGCFIIVQIRCVGVGNECCFLIQRIRFFSFHMLQGHAGSEGGDDDEAEEAENQICQQEF